MVRQKNDKDLVQLLSQFGRGVKKLFASSKKEQTQTQTQNTQIDNLPQGTGFSDLPKVKPNEHTLAFGVVYANDLAKTEIEKENPRFPVGSIIVREKNETATSEIPLSVIAMVKREEGFSKETGDWEFFVFNGADLKVQRRETQGNCAACHAQAEKTDWVFRDYLK